MNLSLITQKLYKNTVERILHVPGNFTAPPLEMAVVIDGALDKTLVEEAVPALLGCLKNHSEVFRNVRLNVVEWKSDEWIKANVCPMSMVMMKSFYREYTGEKCTKHFEKLAAYLKMYQARSRLIILVTDGGYVIERDEELAAAMLPFLEKRLMEVVFREDGEPDIRYRFRRTV